MFALELDTTRVERHLLDPSKYVRLVSCGLSPDGANMQLIPARGCGRGHIPRVDTHTLPLLNLAEAGITTAAEVNEFLANWRFVATPTYPIAFGRAYEEMRHRYPHLEIKSLEELAECYRPQPVDCRPQQEVEVLFPTEPRLWFRLTQADNERIPGLNLSRAISGLAWQLNVFLLPWSEEGVQNPEYQALQTAVAYYTEDLDLGVLKLAYREFVRGKTAKQLNFSLKGWRMFRRMDKQREVVKGALAKAREELAKLSV